jgi:hypothetical protein
VTPWDDANNEYNDVDDDCLDPFDDDNEFEDERASLRGTSQCDNLCDPQCDWCLVAHDCHEAHSDGPCPYDSLDAEHDAVRKELDALDGPIVFPNDVRIEVIEYNGDAFKVYQDQIEWANREIDRVIMGPVRGVPIRDPDTYIKAADILRKL